MQSDVYIPLQQKLKEFQHAKQALLATNFYNFETLKGVVQAAHLLNSPVILQLTRSSIEYIGLPVAIKMAESILNHYNVEGWVHLDHGDSYDLVAGCLDAGFHSVMIDASVNALAVAIGSAHGFYKEEPKLDIERLSAINLITDAALVLHGASGIPHHALKEAIQHGICKINLATEIKNIFMKTLKNKLAMEDEIDLRKVFPPATAAVTGLVREKLVAIQSDSYKPESENRVNLARGADYEIDEQQ